MLSNKILSIQYLRGIAALGVVFCHYGSNISSVFNFGQTGVFVFFLISGFIIVYSLVKSVYKKNQFFIFLLKRSIRIDPSYLATILLTFLLFDILSNMPSFKGHAIPFVSGQFLAHLFYLVPFTKYPFYNHVFWTLCVEFQFYLLIGIFYFISDSPVFKSVFLVVFSCTCFIYFSKAYYLVFNYAPIFALGISLIAFYQNRKPIKLLLPILLLILIAYKFSLPISILLLASCVVILYFKMTIRPLAFFGDISYSLYLTHGLTLTVFLGIAKRLNVNLNHFQFFWLIIEVSIAVAMSYLFFLLIEKPSLRLSKGLLKRNRLNLKLQAR